MIVVAPTQSHKTTGLAIPAPLEWEGPVLATSVKTDLLLDTLANRESRGSAMRVANWLAAAARNGSAAGLQDADSRASSCRPWLLIFARRASTSLD